MSKQKRSGYYWLDKSLTCNGCKHLDFAKCVCLRNQTAGKVRPLHTYTNGDDYVAVLKPSDCNYKRSPGTEKNQKTA